MASSRASGSEHRSDPASPAVSAAGGLVSDTIMAIGDAMGTTVHAAGNVSEEVVLTVGRVGRTAIDQASDLLTAAAGGLRNTLAAGFRGTPVGRAAEHSASSSDESRTGG